LEFFFLPLPNYKKTEQYFFFRMSATDKRVQVAETLEVLRIRPGLKDRQASGLPAVDRQASGLIKTCLDRQASGVTAADKQLSGLTASDKQPSVLKAQASTLKRAKSKFMTDRIVREATDTTEAAERKAKQDELVSTMSNGASNLSQKMLDDLERKKGMIDAMRTKRGRNKDDPVVYVIEMGDKTIISTCVLLTIFTRISSVLPSFYLFFFVFFHRLWCFENGFGGEYNCFVFYL
jgi:hypothetical protein